MKHKHSDLRELSLSLKSKLGIEIVAVKKPLSIKGGKSKWQKLN